MAGFRPHASPSPGEKGDGFLKRLDSVKTSPSIPLLQRGMPKFIDYAGVFPWMLICHLPV